VIGRIETIDAVVAVQAALTSGFLRLMRYVMPTTILKNRIAALSSQIDSFLVIQKDLLEQIGVEFKWRSGSPKVGRTTKAIQV
jgi:hypothetical protein